MIALEQARKHLDTLALKQAVEALDNSLDTAANEQLTYPEMLSDLLGAELAAPPASWVRPVRPVRDVCALFRTRRRPPG